MFPLQEEIATLERKLSDAHQLNAHLSRQIAIKDHLTEHLEAELKDARDANDNLQLLRTEAHRTQKENIRLKKLVCHELFIISINELHTC